MDKRVSIPKILNVSLLLCNVVQAESSLSKCKGDDDTQWKNCQGMYYKDHPKRRGYKVRYTGEFGDVAGMRNGQGTSEIYKKGKLFGTYVGVFKDNKYKVCTLLEEMMSNNKLGVKTKEGFYKY